ncbi:hypothetical protein GQ53DRAFT_753222, partial [Thozetella sp. PMI_491]
MSAGPAALLSGLPQLEMPSSSPGRACSSSGRACSSPPAGRPRTGADSCSVHPPCRKCVEVPGYFLSHPPRQLILDSGESNP